METDIEAFCLDFERNVYLFENINTVNGNYEFLGLEPNKTSESFRFTIHYIDGKFSISSKLEILEKWIARLNDILPLESSFIDVLEQCTHWYEIIMEGNQDKLTQLAQKKLDEERIKQESLEKEQEEKVRIENEKKEKEMEEKKIQEEKEKIRKEKELQRRKQMEEDFKKDMEDFWKKREEEDKQKENEKKEFKKFFNEDPEKIKVVDVDKNPELKKIHLENQQRKRIEEEMAQKELEFEKIKRKKLDEKLKQIEQERQEIIKIEQDYQANHRKKLLAELEKRKSEKSKICENCNSEFGGQVCSFCYFSNVINYKQHPLEDKRDESHYLLSCLDCQNVSLEEVIKICKKHKEGNSLLNTYDLLKKKEIPEKIPSITLKEEIAKIFYNQKSENDSKVLQAISGGFFSKNASLSLVTRDHILLGFSDSLIYVCLRALLRKSDHVILAYPCHQSLYTTLVNIGCTVSLWKAKNSFGWKYKVQECLDLITKDTKMLISSFPNNVVGARLTKDERKSLIRGLGTIPWICDESLCCLEEDPRNTLISVIEDYEYAISINSMEQIIQVDHFKSVSWICSKNKELLEKIYPFIPYKSSKHLINEHLTTMLLKCGDSFLSPTLKVLKENLMMARGLFLRVKDLISDFDLPVSGTCGLAEIPSKLFGKSPEEFLIELQENSGIWILPGSIYDWESKTNKVLLGYGKRHFKRTFFKLTRYLECLSGTRRPEEINPLNEMTPVEVFSIICSFLSDRDLASLCLTSYDVNSRVNLPYFWKQKCLSLNKNSAFDYVEDVTVREKYRLLKTTYSGDECIKLAPWAFFPLEIPKKSLEKEMSIEFWFEGQFGLSVNGMIPFFDMDIKKTWKHCAIIMSSSSVVIYINSKFHSEIKKRPKLKSIDVVYAYTDKSGAHVADLKIFAYARNVNEVSTLRTRPTPIDHPGLIMYLITHEGKLFDLYNGRDLNLKENPQFPFSSHMQILQGQSFGNMVQLNQGKVSVIKMHQEFDNFRFLNEQVVNEDLGWDSDFEY